MIDFALVFVNNYNDLAVNNLSIKVISSIKAYEIEIISLNNYNTCCEKSSYVWPPNVTPQISFWYLNDKNAWYNHMNRKNEFMK